jgi:hypothetical protein
MKFRFLIIGILFFIVGITNLVQADVPGPKVIRKQLLVALENKKLTDSLFNILSAEPNKSALNICYLGVVEALKAKHAWNPYYKVKYLNDAEKTLQAAVNRDPDNMEIRFMRFSIEHNVPGFLGYTKHLVADREAMIKLLDRKHYTTADHEVVVTIVKFLIDSKRCTPQENDKLHKHLAALQ